MIRSAAMIWNMARIERKICQHGQIVGSERDPLFLSYELFLVRFDLGKGQSVLFVTKGATPDAEKANRG